MAGRRKQGETKDLMDLVATLPWWGGVALAVVGYLVLHQFAVLPTPSAQPGQMAGFAGRTLLATFAYFFQYFFPLMCLLGALVSFLKRRKRAGLVDQVTQGKGPEMLNGMSWREFELLVGEAFRLQGYAVREQGGSGADGGVDLVLQKDRETYLVQCKQWKAFKVSVQTVRELYGVMAAQGAAGGFVITSGRFTSEAVEWAEGRNIELMDGDQLFALIQQAKASRTGEPTHAATAEPACPVCQHAMVRRKAGKGANAGAQFWGCSQFPACRGTR
nr:restriction endonuclease [uncultured Ramlibacter sp.]